MPVGVTIFVIKFFPLQGMFHRHRGFLLNVFLFNFWVSIVTRGPSAFGLQLALHLQAGAVTHFKFTSCLSHYCKKTTCSINNSASTFSCMLDFHHQGCYPWFVRGFQVLSSSGTVSVEICLFIQFATDKSISLLATCSDISLLVFLWQYIYWWLHFGRRNNFQFKI